MNQTVKVRVKNIRKNSKTIDLKNLGEVLLHFDSITRGSLERIFSTQLSYYLKNMVESEEVKTTQIMTTAHRGGETAYHYNKFNKESQILSELFSFYPYFLDRNGIKYGKISVNPKTKNVKIPLLIDGKAGELYRYDTEVYILPEHKFVEFEAPQESEKLPVFIVDSMYNAVILARKIKTGIIIGAEYTGRTINIEGIYVLNKQPHPLNRKTILKHDPKHSIKITKPEIIEQLTGQYSEAQKRAVDIKKRLNK